MPDVVVSVPKVVRWMLALGAMRVVSYLTMPWTVPKAIAALRTPLDLLAAVDAAGWLALSISTSLLAGAVANRYLKRRYPGAIATPAAPEASRG